MDREQLKDAITRHIELAEAFPEPYRPVILAYLLGNGGGGGQIGSVPPEKENREVPTPAAPPATFPSSTDSADPLTQMADAARLPVTEVRKLLGYDAGGKPVIKAIAEEYSIAQRQIMYSVLYLYAAETAGIESASTPELRTLCETKKSYDSPNFTRNFKASDYIARSGDPGSKSQEWRLSKEGRSYAIRLLRALSGEEPLGRTNSGERRRPRQAPRRPKVTGTAETPYREDSDSD